MGGAKHCSQCQTSHEGPVGRKCVISQQQEEVLGATSGEHLDQASTSLAPELCINEEQARLAVTQVHSLQSPESPNTSTGASISNQNLLLAELQKISQRFGKLEEQAAIDRQVLSGVVSQLKNQASTSGSSNVNSSQVQKVNSVKSPKHSKQGSSGSVKGQVESQKEGYHSGVYLTEQQQGLAMTGVKNKHSASHLNNITYIQPVSRSTVPFQDNVYAMSSVEGTGGQHSMGRMVSNSDALMTHQNLPGAAFPHNSLSFASQLQQGQVPAQGVRPEVQQQNLGTQEVTVNRVNSSINVPIHTHTVTTPCVSIPATQVNNSIPEGHMRQDNSSTTASGASQGYRGMATQETTDTVIPSLQALRNSADIHRKVNARYQELEDSSQIEQGSLELLLQTLHKKVKNDKPKVKWPQDLAFVGTLRRRPTYEQLTLPQWLLGFLRIRQEEQDPQIKENMIEYLTELAQDACDYSWDAAKGAHSILLHRMGDGVLNWANLKDIQKIRKRYAQTTSAQSGPDKSKSLKVLPCIQYNKGMCNRPSKHEWKNMLLKHMCQYCFTQNNRVESHTKKDCWRANKDNAKNP